MKDTDKSNDLHVYNTIEYVMSSSTVSMCRTGSSSWLLASEGLFRVRYGMGIEATSIRSAAL